MSHRHLILVSNDREPILLTTCQSTVSTVDQRSRQNIAIKDLSRKRAMSTMICIVIHIHVVVFFIVSYYHSRVSTSATNTIKVQQHH